MRKKLLFLFLFISTLGFAQNVDIYKVKQARIEGDSALTAQISNYALSGKSIKESGCHDTPDIYQTHLISMNTSCMSIYLFTMPNCSSPPDWGVILKKNNNLSFYSYDLYLYRLVYDLACMAEKENSTVSLAITHAIYDLLSYCSDLYNEVKYEKVDNNMYGYSVSNWYHIFKRNDFDFYNQWNDKEGNTYIPPVRPKLPIATDARWLTKADINSWLKKTYGVSNPHFKLYEVLNWRNSKSLYLLETKHIRERRFDFIFQTHNSCSFYQTDNLFIPLAFKMKDFARDSNHAELLKALKYLCLSYM